MDNKQAARKLKVTQAGYVFVHDFAPKYLGVTLDRSLTYRKHTENVRDKVKSRRNIISKLAGTDCGAPAPVLLAHLLSLWYIQSQNIVCHCGEDVLMYSTLIRNLTSRCVPSEFWVLSSEFSGALRPTNNKWLPVLSNIEPLQIRRNSPTLQEYKNAQRLTDRGPIKEVVREPSNSRIRSRRPFVTDAARLASLNQTEQDTWEKSWKGCHPDMMS